MLKRVLSRFVVPILKVISRFKEYLSTILKSTISLYVVLRNSEFNLPINKIQAGDNEECIVMGNAPSLNKVFIDSPSFFVGKKKMCVNEFARSKYFEIIKPEYYLLVDSVYWEDSASEKYKEMALNLHETMKEKIKWPIKIFMPMQARKRNMFEELSNINKNIEVCYFNMTSVSPSEPLKYRFFKKNLAMPLAQNVLIAGIFIALNINFKKIYVLGADHSWHETIYIDDNNDLYCKEPHFYEDEAPNLTPVYRNVAATERMKLHEFFACLSRKFENYIELEEYSKHIGSKIYNATNRSFIDAFERFKILN